MRTYRNDRWQPRFAVGEERVLPDGRVMTVTKVDSDKEIYWGMLDGQEKAFAEEFLTRGCHSPGDDRRRP